MRVLIGLILVVPILAHAQPAPPLAPYQPSLQTSPLAPPPGIADPSDGPQGDVKLRSNAASNIDAANTRSPIAPILPDPNAAADSADAFLQAAQHALTGGQTGAAQEALERAESRLLDRDVAPSQANDRIEGPRLQQIEAARAALAVDNVEAAQRAIATALRAQHQE